MSVFIRMTAGMETHYPGFWEEIIVVGAPAGSRIGLEAVRPVMSPQTREILKIFDMNKRQWGSYLDERISPDQRTTRLEERKKSMIIKNRLAGLAHLISFVLDKWKTKIANNMQVTFASQHFSKSPKLPVV
ncbi:putative SEC14-like protein 6 [Orchesella cincta]|uniref:Putative SEC14-like protein 6 n=1 Tax=Orchesella cincta TaxID=48709 RepID=A0A1D2MFK0_ORCCI|nr:putative SEC14-like protein 6 [Orchesella cincta]